MRSRSSRRNEIGGRIGLELRALYGEVLREPLPERFCELLDRLEEKTTTATASFPSTRQRAPFPLNVRADRKVSGLLSRQRGTKVNCLEPAE
jgi:hypothetical protein